MYTCDICDGGGKTTGTTLCKNCGGTGKVDWIRNIVSKGNDNDRLVWACINGNLEKVKFLVKQGVSIYDSALHFACANGHLEVVKYLVEQGVDVYSYKNGAIRTSAHRGHLEVVKYLVEQGADIFVDNNFPLRWSLINGHLELAEYLKEQMEIKNKG